MNAEQQRGRIAHSDDGTGGTRDAAYPKQQTFPALDPQRALTDQLMEQICDPKNPVRAYRQVPAKKPGVDGMTVHELANWLRHNYAALTASLLNGAYQPQPVRGVQIPKPGGGQRTRQLPDATTMAGSRFLLPAAGLIGIRQSYATSGHFDWAWSRT